MLGFLSCLSVVFLLTLPAGAQETSGTPAGPATHTPQPGEDTITPSQVSAQVTMVRDEINLIRLEVGMPEIDPPPIHVEEASPREVYFQAVTLFRKSNRLAFEYTREEIEEPPLPAGKIRPEDVYSIVTAALERVRIVKAALAIPEQPDSHPLDPEIEPVHVFNTIVIANRELNQLLERRFAPSDVYEQVTTAIAYLSRLLDSPGEVSTPPDPPAFERKKRPADVYRRLVGCFRVVRGIGEQSGVPMLNLEVKEEQIDGVQPSDVYDVASLLVSELAHLHERRPGSAPPRQVYYPGRKTPSDVYQRIGILSGQLEALQLRIEENPGWLKG